MDEDLFVNLLYKRLSGEITEEESVQLEQWLSASDNNRQTAADIELVWNESRNLGAQPDVDLDAAFAELDLDQDLGKESPTSAIEVQAGWSRRSIWSIAAGILLVAVVGFVIWSQNSTAEVEWKTASAEEGLLKLTLADQSVITLNQGASLQYPTEFDGETRTVKLEGEGFFEVAKDPAHPFVVETQALDVRVLGTEFNVLADGKADPEVQVVSGKVEVKAPAVDKAVLLGPGEIASWDPNTEELLKSTLSSPNALAWRTQKFVFNDQPLPQAIEALERTFRCTIELENPDIGICPVTSTYDQLGVDEILQEWSTIFGLEVRQQGAGKYLLAGGSCQ